jgi:hypothetical protein
MSAELIPPTFIVGKLAAAAGGLLGGLCMFAFMKPRSILDASIRGGVSTGSAIIASPIFSAWIKLGQGFEALLFCGACIGFVAWGMLSMLARFFIRAEETKMDIIDTYKEIKK